MTSFMKFMTRECSCGEDLIRKCHLLWTRNPIKVSGSVYMSSFKRNFVLPQTVLSGSTQVLSGAERRHDGQLWDKTAMKCLPFFVFAELSIITNSRGCCWSSRSRFWCRNFCLEPVMSKLWCHRAAACKGAVDKRQLFSASIQIVTACKQQQPWPGRRGYAYKTGARAGLRLQTEHGKNAPPSWHHQQ